MTTKDEALEALTQTRAGYKEFVKQVDAELSVERHKRLAVHQGTIYHQVAEAWTLGASIAEIKRAYGTKDYLTIRKIIDGLEETKVVTPALVQKTAEQAEWFEVVRAPTERHDGAVYVGEASYNIVLLDDGADLLLVLDEGADDLGFDGEVESYQSSVSQAAELFRGIRKTMT